MVEITLAAWDAMLSEALRTSNETGGILVGAYHDDHKGAVVRRVVAGPPDSRGSAAHFHRGIAGIQELLNEAWREGEYYLGEWHTHPFGSVAPSGHDVAQMRAISRSPGYACPEPLLVVIAPQRRTMDVGVHLFRDCERMELLPCPKSDR